VDVTAFGLRVNRWSPDNNTPQAQVKPGQAASAIVCGATGERRKNAGR